MYILSHFLSNFKYILKNVLVVLRCKNTKYFTYTNIFFLKITKQFNNIKYVKISCLYLNFFSKNIKYMKYKSLSKLN